MRISPNYSWVSQSPPMDTHMFPKLLRSIYDAVDALEAMFPGRHFTPDGHMVGSLGEALAAHHYGIQLSHASSQCHDGVCESRQVQVKATQGNRVAISSEPELCLFYGLIVMAASWRSTTDQGRWCGNWSHTSLSRRTASTNFP